MSVKDLTTKFATACASVQIRARMDKSVDENALTQVNQLLSEASAVFEGDPLISREFVRHGLLLFMGLLAEAEHARNEEKKGRLLEVAWDVAERLRKVLEQ